MFEAPTKLVRGQVCKLAGSTDAYKNAFVLHPSRKTSNSKHLYVKNGNRSLVANVSYNPTNGENFIGMNALQRAQLGCDYDGFVEYNFVEKISDLSSGNFTLDLLVKRKAFVDEEKLVAYLHDHCAGMSVSVDGVLVISFDDCVFRLIPQSLSQFTTVGDSADVIATPAGVISRTTSFDITPSSNPLLVFTKSKKRDRVGMIRSDWRFENMGIGGLDDKFADLFRRAFVSRLLPAEDAKRWNVKHVKGMLLYGPPGTGKTLIARQIGKMLNGVEPTVVNGPEILNKFVGQSEENMRKLFEPAEQDYAENGDEADLHIIIFDEIDAICKARGSGRSSTGVNDTVVNQLLTKLDGVDTPPNILVIGMTNRKDMLDPALLRPGRLEIHLNINLPDHKGRIQILNIHTKHLRENGVLADDVDLEFLAGKTKNFSGAELHGLVTAATSRALSTAVNMKATGGVSLRDDYNLSKITLADFMESLPDITPAYGVDEDDLRVLCRGGIIDFSPAMTDARAQLSELIGQACTTKNLPRSMRRILVHGQPGSGLSTIVSEAALEANVPFVKLISAAKLRSLTEYDRIGEIDAIFHQAYDSPLSLIVIDGFEHLVDYFDVGPRFSTVMMSRLLVLMSQPPPKKENRLIIVANTAMLQELSHLGLTRGFDFLVELPLVNSQEEVDNVAAGLNVEPHYYGPVPVGIKKLTNVLLRKGTPE